MVAPAQRFLCFAVLASLALAGCRTTVLTPRGGKIDPQECTTRASVTDSVFLIGDAGDPRLPREGSNELVDPVMRGLNGDVRVSARELGEQNVYVIFLGDNVYSDGLPREGHPKRRRGERILEAQIAASEPARAIFVMGNHDWHIEGLDGWNRVLHQRAFLERFAPRVVSRPPAGCAGPDRTDVGEHLRFVFLDPIGIGHLFAAPEEHQEVCPNRTVGEAYFDLAAEFDHPDGRHVVLALHHPLITAGPHGGHFGWKQHIFPLTDFWSWAWLPLPVIGSVYPIARQLGVTGTDLASEPYTRTISGIYRASRPFVPGLFVGGHEHSLQLHRDWAGVYYLVSGAGSASKVDRVIDEKNMDTLMKAAAKPGYMRLDQHADGALALTIIAIDDDRREEIYHHCVAQGPPEPWRDPARRSRH